MLGSEEIKQKIETLEAQAATLAEPEAAHYSELAMKWRLIAVEAVFMGAIDDKLADEPETGS